MGFRVSSVSVGGRGGAVGMIGGAGGGVGLTGGAVGAGGVGPAGDLRSGCGRHWKKVHRMKGGRMA